MTSEGESWSVIGVMAAIDMARYRFGCSPAASQASSMTAAAISTTIIQCRIAAPVTSSARLRSGGGAPAGVDSVSGHSSLHVVCGRACCKGNQRVGKRRESAPHPVFDHPLPTTVRLWRGEGLLCLALARTTQVAPLPRCSLIAVGRGWPTAGLRGGSRETVLTAAPTASCRSSSSP